MEIEIRWAAPFKLGKYYKLEDPKWLPDGPGVYLFARIHGKETKLIYIGKATNLKERVIHQLKNRHLRRKMKRKPQVSRVLFIGKLQNWNAKEKVEKALRIVESALIAHALAKGHDLVNEQGKHRPTHNLTFKGNFEARNLTGKSMLVRKTSKG
jgi:hypothetical protein